MSVVYTNQRYVDTNHIPYIPYTIYKKKLLRLCGTDFFVLPDTIYQIRGEHATIPPGGPFSDLGVGLYFGDC